jgi:4-hydroxy-4-methyl-2-oxoglutarate aldolase
MISGSQHADGNRGVEKLYTAVLADILDSLGYRHQAIDPGIAALDPLSSTFGRALTVRAEADDEIAADPYRKELEAVDALQDGDILVGVVDGETTCGFWGGLLTAAAQSKGARGVVIDGYTRDSMAIVNAGFPVFARGCSPLDSKGRCQVVTFGEPVLCGGVEVSTGDHVFCDRDGVVVIPASVLTDVLAAAREKADVESDMHRALLGGMGVIEAYDRYGVL